MSESATVRRKDLDENNSKDYVKDVTPSVSSESSGSCVSGVEDAYPHESAYIGGRKLNIKGSGVVNVEIYRKQYSGPLHKIMLFSSLFLVSYAYGLDNLVRFTFQYQATSKFKNKSLLRTINCIKTVMGAAGQLGFARASDIFGRMTILIFSLLLYVVGTIIQCQATNISKFGAGTCIYQLGITGIQLLLEIIAMDFSDLNWRVLASFIPATPFIINIWISGGVTQAIGDKWSWGIGMWAIILPCSCVPLGLCAIHMRYLAVKNEPDKLQNEFKMYKGLTWREYLVDIFFWRLDSAGFVLLCVVFGCILVPLVLAGGYKPSWRSAHIIVPEVMGWLVALPVFLLWEAKFAKHPLVSWDFIQDRGIIAALVIAFFINFNWYLQGDYMFTVLLVAYNQSVLAATRISSMYSFVCIISGTLLGFAIVKARRTKYFIIFGIGCWFIAFGLLVHFSTIGGSSSGITGSLCLLGFGAGFFTYTTQASIQAATKTHAQMAVATALYLSIYSIGSAVGSAVSGAIWTSVLPREIYKTMNASDAAAAYKSPNLFTLDNPWGSKAREGMTAAYGYVLKILCVAGLCFCVPLLIAALFLRNHKLESTVALEHVESSQVRHDEKKHDLFYKIKSRCGKRKNSSLPR
ncbi:hypothetical protein HG535_0C06440 [Zygotorulaspora mrakii]|uniref:Major facilitator superfamily (MFS) profile domain-containing protein n=1 Tax=Zygotorulaspora mrakii TaxID=42260 RepID=A0A7H9B2U0_ZYGMR|nr:uncharacterized protein HG535_0C06440 [Zygotorulaspora mrakii]QLG72289.1 hypothetical protein HG535_0C06440 [Zygotorulaspora mrakii]